MIEEVKAFRTSDGHVWCNEKVALRHQVEIDIECFVRKTLVNGDFAHITHDNIVEALLDNADEVGKLLLQYRDTF